MDTNPTSEMLSEANFGPFVGGRFDFTISFESAILSILPSSLFFILAPQRLRWLIKQPCKVTKSSHSAIKLGLIGVYASLQLAVLLYCVLGQKNSLRVQTTAAAFVFVNGLRLMFVSYAEHTRSVRPSTLISTYFLFTLLFDCAIARTLWIINGTRVDAQLFTSSIAIKFLALGMEALDKRSILLDRYQDLSPEVTSGILSRSIFLWLNSLIKPGFSRSLTDSDLYPMYSSLAARKLLTRVQNTWELANQSRNNSLAFSVLLATKYAFLTGVLPRLVLATSKYTMPFLISGTTYFTENPSELDSIGWGLTGAWLLVFLTQAIGHISNGCYYQMTYRCVTAVRGSLCGLIYCKALISTTTDRNESAEMTLMSTDTENICQSFATIHELWASPIECGVAIYLLFRQLGMAAFAPVIVAIVATIAIMQLANYIGNAQKTWVSGIQKRVDVTSSVLRSMKEVKMLGLSEIVTKMIQDLRVKELELSKRYRRLLCLQVFIDPLVTFIRSIPALNSALACFGRIQNFLRSEGFKDHRLPLATMTTSERTHFEMNHGRSTQSAPVELQDLGSDVTLPPGAPIITFSDASYRWTCQGPPVLSKINTTVRKSHFTFIVGSVGSGKSTLMNAMLGEIRPIEGSVHAAVRKVAFVGQEPWIQNLSIRENILGVSTFNRDWYGMVVRACGLEKDVAGMSDGDATKAGSAGVSLSGGQKQRLALARAVYSKENVIFLDDVFSGQDAGTEEHIFRNLFSERGLFRKMDTTVVCITNAMHRLIYADFIIALDEKGRISHQGSFKELKNDISYLQVVDTPNNSALSAQDEIEPLKHSCAPALEMGAPATEIESPNKILGEFTTYGYYFGSVPIWHTLLFATFVLLYAGGYKMTELLLSYWTAHTNAGQSANNFYLGIYGMLSGLAVLGISGAAYFFLITMVTRSSEVLHTRLLQSVIDAPLAFFSRTDIGVTTNMFSQDMSVIDTELPFALVDFAINFAVLLMGAVLMCVFSGYFAITVPPIALFCWMLQKFYVRTSRQIRILDLEAKSPLFTQFLDLVRGLSSVRAFSWEAQFKEQYLDLLDASQRPYYLLFCIQRWLGIVLDLMVAVLVAITMVLVVKLRSQLSPQFVALALLNVMSFSQSLTHVIQNWTQLETSFGAVARVKTFCAETDSEKLPSELLPVPGNWPSQGHVTIENLFASYTSGGEPVLRGISLDIPFGFKVGICGRSGSGKSSLIGALLRLLETSTTNDSHIMVDGVDIVKLPRQAVRAAIAVVPQHPFFLKNTSVRGNLLPMTTTHINPQALGRNEEDLFKVLSRLNMTGVVERMGGLDATLEADRLSQGQRQLLCLARAMLSGKKIILLDEASSNVDEDSEHLIREVIREHFSDRTVISVVHRLGAVAEFDRVAVLGGGRVLEWDSRQALLARDSEFKRLWDLGPGI